MEIRFTLGELLQFLKEQRWLDRPIEGADPGQVITGFSSIYETRPGTLSWMTMQELDWTAVKASVVICAREAKTPDGSGVLYLPMEQPRNVFAAILRHFYRQPPPAGISPTAIIGEHCQIGREVYIGHHAVIGDHVHIGDYTQVHSNVTIYGRVSIGSHCIIHSGAVIGADGFGYERDRSGHLFKIPHIGSVVIEDHVEIGCNTCVARGVLANTVIGAHAKIGNLSHISHNVVVEPDAQITHQTHLSGSTIIGRNSWIAPGAVIKQGLSVGEHAVVGLGAVVIRPVAPHDVVAGVPAAPLRKTSPGDTSRPADSPEGSGGSPPPA